MNWFEGKKAVVPIDFGDQSKQAIDTALDIIFRPSDIHVVHVSPDQTAATPEEIWIDVDQEQRRNDLEALYRKQFGEEKYHAVPFAVLFGDPGTEIVGHAEKIGADVIIIPSHGRSGISRLLLGSVAERVLRLAHCPVLVLRN